MKRIAALIAASTLLVPVSANADSVGKLRAQVKRLETKVSQLKAENSQLKKKKSIHRALKTMPMIDLWSFVLLDAGNRFDIQPSDSCYTGTLTTAPNVTVETFTFRTDRYCVDPDIPSGS